MLVDTMENVSRPEIRKIPCDPQILLALRAQLARPARHTLAASRISACGTSAWSLIGSD